MDKISLIDFKKIMDCNLIKFKTCIEINFCVDNSTHYSSCWLGKQISKEDKEIYWLGLTEDGMEAYDFDSKEYMINAKIFYGKSLQEIWEMITIISIDACEPKDRFSFYKKNC